MKAELLFDHRLTLGEGPVWDEKTKSLYWVDITKGQVWHHDFSSGQTDTLGFGETVGMVCLDKQGALIAALSKSIVKVDKDKITVLADGVEVDLPKSRFNDGKCDARGRLLVGTADVDKACALYTLEEGQPLRKILPGVSISNGIGFSPDNKYLYYVDTPTRHLWRFDYDLDTGHITNRVPLIDYTNEPGMFDGLCVDDEGMLFIAHWGGYQVSRWNPETGKKLSKIDVPAPFVTSCCFFGEGMNRLFITTCSGFTQEAMDAHPLAGCLFVAEPGVTGPYAERFGG